MKKIDLNNLPKVKLKNNPKEFAQVSEEIKQAANAVGTPGVWHEWLKINLKESK